MAQHSSTNHGLYELTEDYVLEEAEEERVK